jgi:putative (di)nucleoside polyphosphate hydrolase
MYRELFEEIGLDKSDVKILGKTKDWLRYDLPKKFQRKTNNQLCIGQKQVWFLLRLVTKESSINLLTSNKPEFDSWKWVNKSEPLETVIDFKREVYMKALNELMPYIEN